MAVEEEEAIRAQLREASRKKRRALEDAEPEAQTADKPQPVSAASADADKERKSSRRERSRSPRRRERRRDSRRERGSRRRGRSASRSASDASRSRSRSRSASPSGRSSRRRRHSTHKRRASRSTSRGHDASATPADAKRSRHRSRSTSAKRKPDALAADKQLDAPKKDEDDETETENEVEADKPKPDAKPQDKPQAQATPAEPAKDARRKSSSRKSSRRSRSRSPRSPSRSSRRRRRRSYSRSPSRSRRARRGGSRSRSPPRDRRARGRDRERERRRSRRGRRSASRSRSRSRSRSYSSSRRRRHGRSSSRDRVSRHQAIGSPPAPRPAPGVGPAAPVAPGAVVNPTITQLMAQYPTLSLQEIIAKMQASNVTMAAAVAQKPARELYVGNLPPNVTGPQLQEFLGTIIQQVGLCPQPGNPIVNTWLSADGHFAFCEMRSAEDCNLALLLNQLSLLGQPLKFGRPRSFMGPLQPPPQISARTQTALANLGCTPNPAWFSQPAVSSVTTGLPTPVASSLPSATLAPAALPTSQAAPASLATGVRPVAATGSGLQTSATACRLIMMNVPTVLTEEQVRELVEPFGEVKTFSLVKDSGAGVSLGSAVLEYKDDSVAAQAVEGLNGLEIGGIALSVQRQGDAALVTAPPPKTAVAKPEEEKSPVLKMGNMVSVDELKDDEEFADLTEDVEEECKRFGAVTALEIPRPKDGEDVPGLGSIYVRFEKEDAAAAALKALAGRKFGGKTVQVSYFAVDKFEKRAFA